MTDTVDVTMTLPAPPKGYAYTGEFRAPTKGEWYRHMSSYGNWSVAQAESGYAYNDAFILRPVQPATVMVELTREDVTTYANDQFILSFNTMRGDRLAAACRAALTSKAEAPKCGVAIHVFRDGASVCYSDSPAFCKEAGRLTACILPRGHKGAHRA